MADNADSQPGDHHNIHNGAPLPFSVDLLDNANKHINFLRAVHSHGVSLSRPSPESLRRYRDLWLPLVFRHANRVELVPPADVAWLWHCHRLAPFRYIEHLKRQFGLKYFGILEAKPPFTLQLYDRDLLGQEEPESPTQALWKLAYPDEPFLLDEDKSMCTANPNSNTCCDDEHIANGTGCDNTKSSKELLLSGFDLLASTDRQATFLWQVSGPKFSDRKFLEDGVYNYYKFLSLRKHAPTQVIVPTYQIDLMWHTHILSSLCGYYDDCRAIIGSTLHHDDSLNDRTDGGTLDVAFRHTKALWSERYGTEYSVAGGMYRGEPPQEYYDREWGLYNGKDLVEVVPLGRFLHLVGIHGASSTNPVGIGQSNESTVVVWCWKDDPSRMWLHSASEIVGDPSECWIRYSEQSSIQLESVFQGSGGKGFCSVVAGYTVYFSLMKQTKDSTGESYDVKRFTVNGTDVAKWTSPDGLSADSQRGFIPANDKSQRRGVNANPKRINYVFGRGLKGLGYYHVSTRDAHILLQTRIKFRLEALDRQISNEIACSNILCCGMGGTPSSVKRNILREENLRCIHNIVFARASCDAPIGEVGVPKTWENDKTKVRQYYSDTGVWLFPPSILDAGGGCGATGNQASGCGGRDQRHETSALYGGGGCGGGGCGGVWSGGGVDDAAVGLHSIGGFGGGCGGGGCGGGGCGGGGCGGGGCGGGG